MLIAVYKCLFGIVKTVADDFEFGTSQIISLSEITLHLGPLSGITRGLLQLELH